MDTSTKENAIDLGWLAAMAFIAFVVIPAITVFGHAVRTSAAQIQYEQCTGLVNTKCPPEKWRALNRKDQQPRITK